MFTKRTIFSLKILIKLHHFCRCGPFVWDSKTSLIRFHKSKLDWALLWVTMVWYFCRVLNTYGYFLNGVFSTKPLLASVGAFLQVQWHTAVVLYLIAMFRRMHEIKEFVNCLIEFNRKAAVTFMGTPYPVKKDGCEKFLYSAIIATLSNPLLLMTTAYRKNPLNPRFLYRFIAKDNQRTWLFYAYGVVEYFGQLLLWYPWALVGILIWLYCKSTIYWIRQMRYGVKRTIYKRPKDILSLYESLRILNLQFNTCMSELAMPTFVLHTLMAHIVLNCMTVKLRSVYPPTLYALIAFWSCLWFRIEGVVFSMLGKVNLYSERFLKSWYDQMGVKGRRKIKAMRPLGIKLGHVYDVHRTTVLFIYLTVINTTVTVLLLH